MGASWVNLPAVLWTGFATLVDLSLRQAGKRVENGLAVVDWRKCRVWMHGGLTHPPQHSWGLCAGRPLSPASRKEDGEWICGGGLAVVDRCKCRVWMHGGLTHPPQHNWGLRWSTLSAAGGKLRLCRRS
jgi:hypothetical protein